MRVDPDQCRDPDLLAREVRRLQAAMDELRAAADQADVAYRDEIARLRLTDAERVAVVRAWHGLLKLALLDKQLADVHLADARTIHALLERTRNG